MAVQDAAANLVGSASVATTSSAFAVAMLVATGLSSITANASVSHEAATTISGLAATTFTGGADGALTILSAKALFYVDPSKVLVQPFIKPTSVVKQTPTPVVPVVQAQAPSGSHLNVTIRSTNSPPQTKTGGVTHRG